MQSVATKQITKTRNAHWRDYLELTKPRVVALLLLTASSAASGEFIAR